MLVRRRSVAVVIAAVALGLFFFLIIRSPRTAGQQNFPEPNRRPACTCFCGDSTFNSFNIFSPEDALAGKCFGGPLPADACGSMGRQLPAEQRRPICERLKADRAGTCPAVKAFCDDGASPPKPDCQKPAPWFDPPPDCKDIQAPVFAINNQAVTVSICGLPIFRGTPPPPVEDLALEAYKNLMTGHVQNTVGSKVCCDTFRNSARTGKPCFPGVDIDCDGVPNNRDTVRDNTLGILYPDINLFTRAPGANIDDFPPGLDPDDPDFLPGPTARASKDVGDCPCKWEMISGKLACSPDGRKDHIYTATWKCPATGKEVFTTKYAKATAPCRPTRQSGGVSLLFEYLAYRPGSFDVVRPVSKSKLCS